MGTQFSDSTSNQNESTHLEVFYVLEKITFFVFRMLN